MTDIEQAKNTSNTSDELRDFKKKLAKDIVDKIQERSSTLAPMLLDETIYNYLLNEENFKDSVADLGRKIILNTANLHFLENYRKKINSAETVSDLEKIKNEILGDIEKKYQGSYNNNSTNNWSNNIWWQENQSQRENQWNAQNTQQNQYQSSNIDTTSQTSTELAKVSWTESYEIDHFNITVSAETKKLWEDLKWKEKPDLEPFACAMKAYEAEKSAGHLKNTKYLTVVDFTKNQLTNNRLFVIDMETNTVTYAEKCGHGEWSGDKEWAKSFSNRSGSHESSLWAFITADKSRPNGKGSWHWNFPKWQESSNSASHWRWIARHPVRSLTYKSWKPTSEGCFTIPRSQAYVDEMLAKTQWWSLLFSYAKSKDYFKQSKYFQQNADGSVAA